MSYDEHLISMAGGDGEVLDQIEARIRDCKTYNFGMRNADKLAHEDAPALLAMVREQRARLDKVAAYCEQATSRISTDPEVGDYERGFDDSTRGMTARIRDFLEPTK